MIILLGTSGGGNDRHDRTAGNKHPGDSRAPLRIGNLLAIKVESDADLDETLPQLVESCVPHVPLIGSSSTKSAHQIPGICLFLIFNFIYIGLIII